MTPTEKLDTIKAEWRRLIIQSTGCGATTIADRILELAELNGLFDPYKRQYAMQSGKAVFFEERLDPE